MLIKIHANFTVESVGVHTLPVVCRTQQLHHVPVVVPGDTIPHKLRKSWNMTEAFWMGNVSSGWAEPAVI